jgi:hypothetical protein
MTVPIRLRLMVIFKSNFKGENKKREWCFVEDIEKGEVRWSYCRLELNYDKVLIKLLQEGP